MQKTQPHADRHHIFGVDVKEISKSKNLIAEHEQGEAGEVEIGDNLREQRRWRARKSGNRTERAKRTQRRRQRRESRLMEKEDEKRYTEDTVMDIEAITETAPGETG